MAPFFLKIRDATPRGLFWSVLTLGLFLQPLDPRLPELAFADDVASSHHISDDMALGSSCSTARDLVFLPGGISLARLPGRRGDRAVFFAYRPLLPERRSRATPRAIFPLRRAVVGMGQLRASGLDCRSPRVCRRRSRCCSARCSRAACFGPPPSTAAWSSAFSPRAGSACCRTRYESLASEHASADELGRAGHARRFLLRGHARSNTR